MNAIALFYPGDSWLHRRDPRVKLGLTVASLILLLSSLSLPLHAVIFLLLIVALRAVGGAFSRLRPLWVGLIPVGLLMLLLRGAFVPVGDPLLRIGPIQLTPLGFAAGAVVGLRILSMAMLILLLLSTTRLRALVQALVDLRVPYAWGLSLALAIRFLPSFVATFGSIRQAQLGRGLDLDQGPVWRRLQRHMPILVAMLVTSLRRADTLAVALEARGYQPNRTPTAIWPLSMRPADWLLLAVAIILSVGGVVSRTVWGIGAEPLWPF